MSIGYDNVTVYDYNQYFAGGYAFKYLRDTGEVQVYHIGSIMMEDEEDNYEEHRAADFSVHMRPVDVGTDEWVDVDMLFNDDHWVVHRFPTMYVTHDDEHLHCISFEPMQRRMHKPMSRVHFRTMSLLHEVPYAGGLTAENAAVAVCKVLEYGHHSLFRPVYDKRKRSAADDLRAGVKVVVPLAWTAFVKDEDSYHLFRNRALVGKVLVKDDSFELQPSSMADMLDDSLSREMYLRGLKDSLTPLLGDITMQEEKD